jgi:hypothetical protein
MLKYHNTGGVIKCDMLSFTMPSQDGELSSSQILHKDHVNSSNPDIETDSISLFFEEACSSKIPRPRGYVSRPNGGGYNLEDKMRELGWKIDEEFRPLKVSILL